jgi:hypothetical protein
MANGAWALIGNAGTNPANNSPGNGFVCVNDAQRIHNARMTFDTSGNSVVLADIVEANVKNFRVAHPTQPDMDIVYACIEGPEAAAYVQKEMVRL